ncbi:MAG: nuclear transport factor 2 family protein [Halioglobus sp.]
MDARLQALLDKQAITELVYAYARAADRHDQEAMRALYHADATDDHGSFFKGLASEFIDQLPQIQEPMLILHHNVTTVNIKLEGEYAEGEVYVLAFHQVATDNEPIDLVIGGRYLDKYQKREDRWKFSARAVLADWAIVIDPTAVQLQHPMIEGSHIGTPDVDDPSYAFFRLFSRGSA